MYLSCNLVNCSFQIGRPIPLTAERMYPATIRSGSVIESISWVSSSSFDTCHFCLQTLCNMRRMMSQLDMIKLSFLNSFKIDMPSYSPTSFSCSVSISGNPIMRAVLCARQIVVNVHQSKERFVCSLVIFLVSLLALFWPPKIE